MDATSRNLIKSAHKVICNVYLAVFMLVTSTAAESSIMENLFSVEFMVALNPRSNAHELSIKISQ